MSNWINLIAIVFSSLLFLGCSGGDNFKGVEELPDDFELYYEESAMHVEWGQEILRVGSEGNAVFTRKTGFEMKMVDEFAVGEEKLLEIYNKALENGFFELQSRYEDPAIMDGGVRVVGMSGGGNENRVTLVNYYTEETDELAGLANKLIPQRIRSRNFQSICAEKIAECSQDGSTACDEWREYCD